MSDEQTKHQNSSPSDMVALSVDEIDAVSGGGGHLILIVLVCLAIRACGTAQGCQ